MQFTDETLEKLQPLEYYREWFKQHPNTRSDNRNNLEYRDTIIQKGIISNVDGSSFVKLGNTTCVCIIKAKVYEITSISPSKVGYIIPNVYMAAGSNSNVRPGAPNDQSQELSCFINEIIDKHIMGMMNGKEFEKKMEIKELVTIPEKIAWCLHVNIEILNDDGNLEEATWLACISALENVELPKIELTEEMIVKIPIEAPRKKLSLPLIPLIFKATLFDDKLLVDPDYRDEEHAKGKIVILFNANNANNSVEIMQMDLFGTDGSNLDEIMQLCKLRFDQISLIL